MFHNEADFCLNSDCGATEPDFVFFDTEAGLIVQCQSLSGTNVHLFLTLAHSRLESYDCGYTEPDFVSFDTEAGLLVLELVQMYQSFIC
jgi:hypothetical protein